MATSASKYLFSQPSVSESDALLMTVFFAVIIHALMFLGIGFAIPKMDKTSKQIEITLANSPAEKAPEKAKYLAQDNQVGAGQESIKPTPPKQRLPSQGDSQNKPPRQQNTTVENRPKTKQKLVTSQNSSQKISTSLKHTPPSEKTKRQLSVDALKQQIAQLGEKIRYSQQSAEQTRIKFVHSVSTHKYVAAQYMKDWEHKVERTGNLNYPEVARKKGFSGSLTMDVGIDANGQIYSMRISKPSGIKALDDAAKRIVRLSAPFAALPKELLEEVDVLVIPRVWHFSDETGVITN